MPYAKGETIESVTKQLESISVKLFRWFGINGMKANPNKCHILLSSNENHTTKIANIDILNSKSEKLLDVIIGNSLKFDDHIQSFGGKQIKNYQRLLEFVTI